MAEFCKDCARKVLGFTEDELSRAVMSEDPDLCEGCGEYKPVVIHIREKNIIDTIKQIFKNNSTERS